MLTTEEIEKLLRMSEQELWGKGLEEQRDEAIEAAIDCMRQWKKLNFLPVMDVTDENQRTLIINADPEIYDKTDRILFCRNGSSDGALFYKN